MNLKDKIAVVAGASGGIGREVSKALAKEGAEVLLWALSFLYILALLVLGMDILDFF